MRIDKPRSLLIVCLVCLCAALALPSIAGAAEFPAASTDRLQQHIVELAKFGANPEGGVSHVAFSAADIAGREYIKGLMQDAGLVVRVDTAGNIIGGRDGSDAKLPVIMTGSHIDSVSSPAFGPSTIAVAIA